MPCSKQTVVTDSIVLPTMPTLLLQVPCTLDYNDSNSCIVRSTVFVLCVYYIQLLKKILKAKGSVHIAEEIDEKTGELPIHVYVKSNDKRKFECLMTYLIHRECDLDHCSYEGMTALHLACVVSHYVVNIVLHLFLMSAVYTKLGVWNVDLIM